MMTARGVPLLTVIVALSCNQAPDGPVVCATDASCPGGYHCGPIGVCVGDVPCLADAGCCLAERCVEGRCRPRSMCSPAAPCGKPASRCLGGMCVPVACAADGDCPADRPCRLGVCSQTTPCGGFCPAGQVCSPLLDRCVLLRQATSSPVCPSGQLALLDNDHNHFVEGCAKVEQKVVCGPLPALPAGDLGWPSVLLDRTSRLGLVARDRTYGDVVLSVHARAPPYARSATIVLAGLPADAPVVGDPKGPRGGIAAVGPDVGRVLAAGARKDGSLDVIYRDATADGVGFVRVVGDAPVGRHTVALNAGLGTGLAIAQRSAGVPVFVAFSPAPTGGGKSALRLFTAKLESPKSASDWSDVLLDSQLVAASSDPCGAPCASGSVCALLPAGAGGKSKSSCVLPGTDCALCLPSQVCYSSACVERSLSPPPLAELAPGRGVHVDLLRRDDGVYLAAYSRTTRDLAFYSPLAAGGHSITVIGGDKVPGGSLDVGRFVRLSEAPGGGVEAWCQDSTGGRLLRIRPGPPAEVLVVDDGNRPDGHHRVGADVAVMDTGTGALVLAYQDTRRSQTVVASMGAKGLGARLELPSQEAGGFSPSIVLLGSKALVVGAASLRFDGAASLRTRVELRSVVMSGL